MWTVITWHYSKMNWNFSQFICVSYNETYLRQAEAMFLKTLGPVIPPAYCSSYGSQNWMLMTSITSTFGGPKHNLYTGKVFRVERRTCFRMCLSHPGGLPAPLSLQPLFGATWCGLPARVLSSLQHPDKCLTMHQGIMIHSETLLVSFTCVFCLKN